MIVVTGATGNVGSVLVRRLAERGVPTRALTRDARRAVVPSGVEVVEGDLALPDSLAAAWDGAGALFLLTTGNEDTAAILESARKAGVRHVVQVSSLLAETHPDSPIGRGALRGEQAVRDSGVAWTVLRGWEFASNALWWAPSIRERGAVRVTGADVASPVVDPADIASVAAVALTERGHESRIHALTGPEEVTARERVGILGRVLGADIALEEMGADEALTNLKRFMPDEVADFMVDTGSGADHGPGVRPTVRDVTGWPARDFRQWAFDHADAFR